MTGANVFVLPLGTKGTTDAKGFFKIEGLPAGDFEIVINVASQVT